MSEDNKYDNGKNDKNGAEFKGAPRPWLIWLLILGTIPFLILFKDRVGDNKFHQLTRVEFMGLVESNLIVSGTINYNPQSPGLNEITGEYRGAENGKSAI